MKVKDKIAYVNEEDFSFGKPQDEEGEANTNDEYFAVITLSDLKKIINDFNLVKKIKRGVIFGGNDPEITIHKSDLDEITDFFDEVDKFENPEVLDDKKFETEKDYVKLHKKEAFEK